jgi:hypothetical protein
MTVETTLVLIWMAAGPTLSVTMPDQPTCQRAVVEAKRELSPDAAYCAPKVARRSESRTMSIMRNMKSEPPALIDTCGVCLKYYGPW